MCDLCSADKATQQRGRDELESAAANLRTMARQLESVARGDLPAHSEASKSLKYVARGIIRYLAAEWM